MVGRHRQAVSHLERALSLAPVYDENSRADAAFVLRFAILTRLVGVQFHLKNVSAVRSHVENLMSMLEQWSSLESSSWLKEKVGLKSGASIMTPIYLGDLDFSESIVRRWVRMMNAAVGEQFWDVSDLLEAFSDASSQVDPNIKKDLQAKVRQRRIETPTVIR